MAMAFRSFAFFSVLISVALAQTSTNPFIPSNISSSCASYLSSFDNNTSFASCTQPFTATLSGFAPGSQPSSTPASAITSVLNTLCNDSTFNGCSQSTITTQLSQFYSACSSELTSSPNQNVKTSYDVLFSLWPLRQALCAKDNSGNYCATQLSNSLGSGSVALVNQAKSQQSNRTSELLYTPVGGSPVARRDTSNSTAALAPNVAAYQTTNLVFLFLQPSMSNNALCTSCTRNILTPYITFESNCPYAPGLANSELFAGQTSLYNNVTSKCGASFLGAATANAGGLSKGIMSGAAPRTGGQELSASVSAILSVAAFVAAAF